MRSPILTMSISLASAFALAGCSLVPGSSGGGDRSDPSPASRGEGMQSAALARPALNQCLTDLGRAGADFSPLPDRYISDGCTNLGTVQMRALAGDRGQFAVSNLGPVTCPVSTAFAAWVRYGVDRAARAVFGSPLASVRTMGSYSCRNVAGTGRRSAHASAAAIDIGGFELEDGRHVDVLTGWNGSREERRFLRLVQQSACKRFDTVLGPDYNAAHHDHLHVEGVIDGESYCR
ncbi:extensin-like domain-containing protein [Aurantiacibacter spongiae]|uniref:Extensin family protein n=1 Tax=Aurantiacibacter spongiae TaxID=2488860 RepID=A0A3N5CPE4_9SPHN|nr:extensin family protein [Aurantiacibacter spongiae]RPF70863.1 extensin family protein [Aurantiacibacter spongiae]